MHLSERTRAILQTLLVISLPPTLMHLRVGPKSCFWSLASKGGFLYLFFRQPPFPFVGAFNLPLGGRHRNAPRGMAVSSKP